MKRAIIFFLILLLGKTLFAQWEQCVIHGGGIKFVETNGTRMFAGTFGNGLFISDDSAQNWNRATNGIPESIFPYSIAFNGNEVYVGTTEGELYKSVNNGDNWGLLQTGNSSTEPILSIVVVGNKILVAYADSSGVFASIDGGNNWTPYWPNVLIRQLLINNQAIILNTFFDGVYKSIDSGITWTILDLPVVMSSVSLYVFDSIIFAKTFTTFHKSYDLGLSWTACNNPGVITALNKFNNHYFAGVNETPPGITPDVYSSLDGLQWQPMSNGLQNEYITSFVDNGLKLYASTYSGIYSLDSVNGQWMMSSNGISAIQVDAFTNIGNSLFAGDVSSGVFFSNNHGINWQQQQYSTLSSESVESMTKSNDTIYVGGIAGLYSSCNYGGQWNWLTQAIGYLAVYGIVANGNNIMIATSQGIYKTSNFGNTWTTCNTGLPGLYVSGLVRGANNQLYAAVDGYGLYTSPNNGATWTYAGGGFPGMPYINCLASCSNYLLAGLEYFNPPVVYSDDYGASWLVGNNSLFGLTVRKLTTIEDFCFAATNGGLYYTKTYGAEWIDATGNLPGNPIAIGNDHEYVFVSVEHYGVWRRLLSDFNIVVTCERPPISPLQVYPNPFKEELILTTPEWEKPGSITIYNFNGGEVSNINTIEFPVTLNVGNLSPGIYLLKLQQGDKVYTYKVVKE